jgi:hypothetical protein
LESLFLTSSFLALAAAAIVASSNNFYFIASCSYLSLASYSSFSLAYWRARALAAASY